MSTVLLAGQKIEVNTEGFMLDPGQWTLEVATEIAREAGIDPLNEEHWTVIDFCRRDNAEKGTPPGVRRITKETGITTREMYQLFPGGPGVLSAKISGLTKPKGCV